jgi:hypothetical protein
MFDTDSFRDNCLLQQAKIAKLDRANEHDLKWLIHWLQHHEGGKGFLDGWEFKACDEKELPDLISIRSRASTDRFTRWLEMRLIPRLPTILLNMFRVSFASLCHKLSLTNFTGANVRIREDRTVAHQA